MHLFCMYLYILVHTVLCCVCTCLFLYVQVLVITSPQEWLEYICRSAHPVLRWLPTKLAEWIGENMQDKLGFPDKADKRAHTLNIVVHTCTY